MGNADKPSEPPGPDEFARMVMDRIQHAGETRRLAYDREKFCITPEGEALPVLNLTNGYQEYCSLDEPGREKVVQRWARNWFAHHKEMPEDFEDVRPDLLPGVRARAFFDLMVLRSQVEMDKPQVWPYQVLGEHLAVGLVYDMHEGMRFVLQDDLDGWGLSLYEALEIARENLSELPMSVMGPQEGEGTYLSVTHDCYDASRMILLDTVRRMEVRGDYVAMIPNRDTLIVTGSEDVPGLEAMSKMAQEALQQHHMITGHAFRLEGEDWEPWLPPRDHPHHQAFKLLAVQSLALDYDAQKKLLDAIHEKRGEGVFVAAYNGMKHEETGAVTSFCVWPGDVHALMPKSDKVALMRTPNDEKSVVADWDRVVASAGDLMEPLDLYPPRWRVRGFMSEEQVAAIER